LLWWQACPAFAAGKANEVTFHKQVEPILQSRCQECHRTGEAAPMSLMTYKEARPWAAAIRETVLTKKMPPLRASSPLDGASASLIW
jgi:hypothetical protein